MVCQKEKWNGKYSFWDARSYKPSRNTRWKRKKEEKGYRRGPYVIDYLAAGGVSIFMELRHREEAGRGEVRATGKLDIQESLGFPKKGKKFETRGGGKKEKKK